MTELLLLGELSL